MALDKTEIIEAALALLNEVGIDHLTTRKLAERLGVQQPALYWHFRSKSALLDAVNEAMITRFHVHRVPAPGEPWDEFTIANARSIRLALLAVRDGARLNAGTRPTTRQFADAEKWLEICVAAGFTAPEALTISMSVARYVVGFVLEEQGEREREIEEADAAQSPISDLGPFPLLLQAVEPLFTGEGTINTEGAFETGLGFLMTGIRASLKDRTAVRRPRKQK
jgi:TetR/AcrR family transcriptional regulator, tetracycline repressor protein